VLIAVAYVVLSDDFRAELRLNGWFRGVEFLAGLLSVVAMTGAASYLFHPRHLPVAEQNRAVALSYYACGPLAMVTWTLPFYAFSFVLSLAGGFQHEYDTPPWLAIVATSAALLVMWLRLIGLGRAALRRWWAKLRVALLTPVLWLLVVGLVGVGLPWVVLYAVTLVYALY